MKNINLIWDTPYVSGPLASTDLHAGGIFFCTPYFESLVFSENGKVTLSREVIESFRPMNGQQEIDQINSYKLAGRHELNSRGYLRCIFDEMELTGLPLVDHPEIITFHLFRPENGFQTGKAYRLIK